MCQVLLIDDSDDVTGTAVALLSDLGAEVRLASSEEEVNRACVATIPQLVIANVEMDAGIGFESIASVRKLFRDVWIIAMTRGQHRELWPKVASSCGASEYVVGPLNPERLAAYLTSDANKTITL